MVDRKRGESERERGEWIGEVDGGGEGRLLLLFTTQRKQQPGIICNVMREKTEREIMCVFVIIITAN